MIELFIHYRYTVTAKHCNLEKHSKQTFYSLTVEPDLDDARGSLRDSVNVTGLTKDQWERVEVGQAVYQQWTLAQ